MPCAASVDHHRPYHIAVAADDGVRTAEFVRLVWIQRGVDPAEDDRRTPGSRGRADLVAAKRIAGVDPDSDDVTGVDRVEIEWLERLINDVRRTVRGRRGRAEHEQPARRDHANAEREMARVHQMDGHRTP